MSVTGTQLLYGDYWLDSIEYQERRIYLRVLFCGVTFLIAGVIYTHWVRSDVEIPGTEVLFHFLQVKENKNDIV